MQDHLRNKLNNLDLVLRSIGQVQGVPAPQPEDGSFPGKPLMLWLESTARCNLRCAKCGHAFDPPDSPRILPRNLPDAVLDDADEYFSAAVKARISGYGEMFLYAKLRHLAERLKHYGCWIEGTTNGVVIDRMEADWLVALGWDQLVVSIDGAEPATMQRLRGADLHKIWSILEYIRDKKIELNLAKPQIVVGFVAQADNIHELPDLVRKLSNLNISYLAVATLHYKKYIPGTDDPYGELYRDFSLGRVGRVEVERLLDESRALALRANIGFGVHFDLDRVYCETAGDKVEEEAPDDLVHLGARMTAQPAGPMQPFYCVYPWTSLFVTARGSTTVCCSMRGDIGTVSGPGDLDRVWNGEPLRQIRSAIARGDVHANCAYCVSRDRHLSSFVDLEAAKAALGGQAPASPGSATVPAQPIFGYVDALDGRLHLRARSRDRVWVSGWVASGKNGAPVREVRLRVEGQPVGTATEFFPRPDVAAHFDRRDLLKCGWRTQISLPVLRPGRYELLVEATDREGISGALAPWPIEIIE